MHNVNTEPLDIEDIEMTNEMKYIKWPSKRTAFVQALSVVSGTIAITVVIAAGDALGMFLIKTFATVFA